MSRRHYITGNQAADLQRYNQRLQEDRESKTRFAQNPNLDLLHPNVVSNTTCYGNYFFNCQSSNQKEWKQLEEVWDLWGIPQSTKELWRSQFKYGGEGFMVEGTLTIYFDNPAIINHANCRCAINLQDLANLNVEHFRNE